MPWQQMDSTPRVEARERFNMQHQYQQYAEEHAWYLQEQREKYAEPEQPNVPSSNVKGNWKTWLQLQVATVSSLVEEPMFAQPKIGEPVLEVTIVGAQLTGPWPHPFLYNLQRPFVRHYIDSEMVGETKPWETDPREPRWNSKMLVLPRGARCSQFEVLNGTEVPLVLGDCAYSTETLWTCAQRCGRYKLHTPIMYKGTQVGLLTVQVRVWDGMPVEESTSLAGLGGTLAGALDNPLMREYGPTGYRSSDDVAFTGYGYPTGYGCPTAGPVMQNAYLPPTARVR